MKGIEFTMGARIEDNSTSVVPGPGTYEAGDVDAMRNKLPAYSMGAKLEDEKKFKTPSPCAYEAGNLDVMREKLPAYSMSAKTELPKDKTPRPSPNAYCPEKVNIITKMIDNKKKLPNHLKLCDKNDLLNKK